MFNSAIEELYVNPEWSRCSSAYRGSCLLDPITIVEIKRLFGLWELDRRGLEEEVPTIQLPFLLLLQELTAHQPGDRNVIGEITPTLVRRLIALFKRSSGLVLQILRQRSCGKWRNASTSSLAVSITGTAPGNCLASIAVTRCQGP